MFKVYGKELCPFCVKAIELLTERKQEFEYIDVNIVPEAMELLVSNNFKTVPQIYDTTGDHVGGYTELVAYYELLDF